MTNFSLFEFMIDFSNHQYWITLCAFSGFDVQGTSLLHLAYINGQVWYDLGWMAGIKSLFLKGE